MIMKNNEDFNTMFVKFYSWCVVSITAALTKFAPSEEFRTILSRPLFLAWAEIASPPQQKTSPPRQFSSQFDGIWINRLAAGSPRPNDDELILSHSHGERRDLGNALMRRRAAKAVCVRRREVFIHQWYGSRPRCCRSGWDTMRLLHLFYPPVDLSIRAHSSHAAPSKFMSHSSGRHAFRQPSYFFELCALLFGSILRRAFWHFAPAVTIWGGIWLTVECTSTHFLQVKTAIHAAFINCYELTCSLYILADKALLLFSRQIHEHWICK